MQGFANREAVATAISSRKATFYSRSQSTLWTKGEISNNFINIHDFFFFYCDRDSVCFEDFYLENLSAFVFFFLDFIQL